MCAEGKGIRFGAKNFLSGSLKPGTAKDATMIAILTGPGAETLRLDVYPEPRRQTGAIRFDDFPDTETDRKALRAVADAIEGDVFFLERLPSVKTIRHAFFDMDSTLIDNECIDDMAAFFGVGEKVADITRRAMEGHLPFTENLKLRVALLKGAPADVLDRTIAGVRYNPGVEALFAFLRENGIKTTIVSGGFRPIALHVARHLGADGVLTNEVVIRDGLLTGEVTGPAGGEVLDAEGKRRALELLTAVAGDKLENAMATGDGANDLLMVKAAGLGVAYHAKAVLTEAADVAVRRGGLDTLTHLFEESWAAA